MQYLSHETCTIEVTEESLDIIINIKAKANDTTDILQTFR